MSKEDTTALNWAHPLVRDWFVSRFGSASEPQVEGWPHILAGRPTLISAPTGSGKTLAAFLACIDRLVRKAVDGKLENHTYVVYVSPLKALSNDIHKNLEQPLAEIVELAKERGIEMQPIRVAVRTGDTQAHERQKMLKHPPHILVTTPESLYILITAEKSRANLKLVETLIVDEIHAVADDKRGAHLCLSLERLQVLTLRPPLRIGLSATQKPIEQIAQYLVGNGRKQPVIVNAGHKRKIDLAIEVPGAPLAPVASAELWEEIYDRIASLVESHQSTLVFVNTRKLAERIAFRLSERLGEDAVASHHGSLSRKIRLAAEHKLKTGQLKVLVATASLELGIDVGSVDLVCQIGSPRSIAVALQRIGRSGHFKGATPKGRVFATTRDQLVECAALCRAISHGDLDKIIIPEAPMDILAQQIVASCATNDWAEDELFEMVKHAYPYQSLTRDQFDDILDMLTEGFSGRTIARGSYLLRDRVNKTIHARRGSRMLAITNGGAIPETGLFNMVAEPEETIVGTLDEDFAVESNRGDVILLGTTSWQVIRVEQRTGRVLVKDAHGAPPSVPFWRGEAPARTEELSDHIGRLRQEISDKLGAGNQDVVDWLKDECHLDKSGAEQLVEYIAEGQTVLGQVPTQKRIIAERFFDEGGGMQLVIHAPFGGRINKAWGLALRKRFCRSFNFELQAAATDDGLNISLLEQHSFPLADVFRFLSKETLAEVLTQAALQTPIFNTRFRWDANRALSLLRYQGGKKVPPQIQRMRAEDLLATVFPQAAACQDNIDGDIEVPDHPLINEVMKDVLTEAMDLEGLTQLIADITGGKIECIAIDTPTPSAFAAEIVNANPYAYLDDAPLEERRARAVEMRRVLPQSVVEEVGRLDPDAIQRVQEEAWPDIRDAHELYDLLQTLIVMPELSEVDDLLSVVPDRHTHKWNELFAELLAAKRVGKAKDASRNYWVTAENVGTFKSIFPNAEFVSQPADIPQGSVDADEGIRNAIKGWLFHLGPTNASELSSITGIKQSDVDQALLFIEAQGLVLRGRYTNANIEEWCERRLLSRIHNLTVGTLRKQIEPVTPAQFMQWLLRWQHVTPGSQLTGERGTLEVLSQLQGFEIPANAWETSILNKRVKKYDPDIVDHLCLTGAIGWGRLSPHPASLEGVVLPDESSGIKRVVPTSIAPVTFFVRHEADWMASKHLKGDEAKFLSQAARDVFEFLKLHGASFFSDISRGVGRLKAEVETALWELVTAGLVTADGFDNLRALIDPKRRAGEGRGRYSRPRHSTGRWSLIYSAHTPARTEAGHDRTEIVEATCWMLLRRYGVVFRDLLARESVIPKWRELLMAFRRLEDRGEVRSGRFVSGFLGEQFALPIAVESLRALRKQEPTGETVTISAADPLNLVGILVPGQKIASHFNQTITYKDGVPVEPQVKFPSYQH